MSDGSFARCWNNGPCNSCGCSASAHARNSERQIKLRFVGIYARAFTKERRLYLVGTKRNVRGRGDRYRNGLKQWRWFAHEWKWSKSSDEKVDVAIWHCLSRETAGFYRFPKMAKSPTEWRIRICVGAISQRFFLRSFVVFYPLLIYEHVVTLNSYRAYRAVFFTKQSW